jgi:hypothetical protein
MKPRPRTIAIGFALFLLLGTTGSGCRKTVSQEEQEEMLRKCHRLSEDFAEDLRDTQKELLPRLATLNHRELVGKLKRAVTKAKEANQELGQSLENARGDKLMSKAQADDLNEALQKVNQAQQTLREVMDEARRFLEERLKRRRKPA